MGTCFAGSLWSCTTPGLQRGANTASGRGTRVQGPVRCGGHPPSHHSLLVQHALCHTKL